MIEKNEYLLIKELLDQIEHGKIVKWKDLRYFSGSKLHVNRPKAREFWTNFALKFDLCLNNHGLRKRDFGEERIQLKVKNGY